MFGYLGDSHPVFDIQAAKTHAGITEVFNTIDDAKKWMESYPDAKLIIEIPNNKDERLLIIDQLLIYNKRIIAIEDGTLHDTAFFGKPPEKIFPKTIIKKVNESICRIIKSITHGTAETI